MAKSTVKHVHGERVAEGFGLSTRSHGGIERQDGAVKSHASCCSLCQECYLLQVSIRKLLFENHLAGNLSEDIEEVGSF